MGFSPFLWPYKAPENILKTALMIKKQRAQHYKDILKEFTEKDLFK